VHQSSATSPPDNTPPNATPTRPARDQLGEIYRRVTHLLHRDMPNPVDETPTEWHERIHNAIDKVAAYAPANANEADYAAFSVIALSHVDYCYAYANQPGIDAKDADRHRNQAVRMGREARGYQNALLRLQSMRTRRDSKASTCESAALTEHFSHRLLTEAAEQLPPGAPKRPTPPPPPEPRPAATRKEPPAPAPAPRKLIDWHDRPEEVKAYDRLRGKTDEWVIVYTEETKLIRQLGHLPEPCPFEPPPPDVLEFILTQNTANLRWADTYVTPDDWKRPAK
jgi:hypothetical protein